MAVSPVGKFGIIRQWLRRPALRLGSGLILLAYVTSHLINHALGLVSMAAAEAGLKWAVVLWHSAPGTVLLYGAALIHIALAFAALYQRRTLRMPAIEWLRIVLGFGMPLLLIGHVVATRTAYELYNLPPEYARVIPGIWSSGNEWMQLGLLAPGWIHGCLGIHIAFGHRRWYRQSFLVLFAFALQLPVLSALGFITMSRELVTHVAPALSSAQSHGSPATSTASSGSPPDQGARARITEIRQTAIWVYALIFVAVAGARGLRMAAERQRRLLVKVQLPDRSFTMPRGWTVLEGLRSQNITHLSVCGGRARCSTCRVQVVAGFENCAPARNDEMRLLSKIAAGMTTRLACQLRPQQDIELIPLLSPADTRPFVALRSGDGRKNPTERLHLLVQLSLQPMTKGAANLVPGDTWMMMQQTTAVVQRAARRLGAEITPWAGDRITLLVAAQRHNSNRAAPVLREINVLIEKLTELTGRHTNLLAQPSHLRLSLHHAPVFVGNLQVDGQHQLAALGDAMDLLEKMANTGRGLVFEVLVSEQAVAWLGDSPALATVVKVANSPNETASDAAQAG